MKCSEIDRTMRRIEPSESARSTGLLRILYTSDNEQNETKETRAQRDELSDRVDMLDARRVQPSHRALNCLSISAMRVSPGTLYEMTAPRQRILLDPEWHSW